MADEPEGVEQARQAALRLLTQRMRGTVELRRRLLEAGHEPAAVEPV
ncbi:MAG: RecX family transcriptional regulator, partial [Armatimonadetes bacterium]|nr:RecX family transcriptional regulator [Armatimonadota bacterium]